MEILVTTHAEYGYWRDGEIVFRASLRVAFMAEGTVDAASNPQLDKS